MHKVFQFKARVCNGQYRPDIDGLRAIAVLPVLMFHANIAGFSGGYIGVDAFFVISGFLITSIIHRQIAKNRFSIWMFYERRIRRIFPALYFVIGVCAPLGFITLFPLDHRDFGQSIAAAAIFSSNILFWIESGYFAQSAELKPLLHTWSLAVEEQYYVLYPLILVALMRWLKKYTFVALIVIWIASFAWSSYLVDAAPDRAFYLSPSRAWELLTGALLTLYARPIKSGLLRETLGAAGLLSIGLAVVLYSKATPFPGAAALLPCLGTAALLWSGMDNTTMVGRLLALRPVVWVGLISYSLYLWHWPMLVFLKHYMVIEPSTWMNILALILSFLLAWFSWRYVEQPFRGSTSIFDRRQVFGFGAAVTAAAFIWGGVIHLTQGLPQRFSPQVLDVYAATDDFNAYHRSCLMYVEDDIEDLEICRLGQKESPRGAFIVWGDSHANALLPGFDKAARKAGLAGEAFTKGSCLPISQVDKKCVEFNNAALSHIASREEVEFVAIVADWFMYIEEGGHPCCPLQVNNGDTFDTISSGMANTIDTLKALGKSILIIGPVPGAEASVPAAAAKALHYEREITFAHTRLAHETRQRRVLSLLEMLASDPAVTVIQPSDLFCDDSVCNVLINESSLYWDSNHLSVYGSELLAPLIYKKMLDLVSSAR